VAQSRFEVAIGVGLTPLVGREEELGLLQQRWTQAKEGTGQVVLLSGEAGIGKSRLVQALKEQVLTEGATRIEFRCSPYHQNSAFYPIIDHLQRLLRFAREDAPEDKLRKLEHVLASRGEATSPLQTETLVLFASLLSLPHPNGVPPLTLSPQKQKQKTQEALVAWLIEEAEKAAVYYYTARLELLRRDAETAYEQAAAVISLSTEQGFASFRAMGTFVQGWAQVAATRQEGRSSPDVIRDLRLVYGRV
jgi:hypothetical protein